MSYGFVYLMANDAFEGLYKIGYTNKSPLQRAQELSGTSSPSDFYVLAYAECFCPNEYEKSLHRTYEDKRVNLNREFFKLEEADLREIIKLFNSFADNVVITYAFKQYISKFLYKSISK
jgi:hypothetical protein